MTCLARAIFAWGAFVFVSGGASAEALQSATLTPKDLRLNFDAKQIAEECKTAKKQLADRLAQISKTPVKDATFANVLVALEDGLADLTANTDPVAFMKYVSLDEKARKAANTCETDIAQLALEVFSREDLYQRVKAVADSAKGLDAVDQLLIDEYLKDFRDNGLELPKAKRKIFLKREKDLVKLQSEFDNNLINWKDTLEVSKSDLEGVPDDYYDSLKKTKSGKYIVTMAYPDVHGVMDNVKNPEIRRQVQYKFARRGGEKNVKILEKALMLRDESAKMLGYKNHAEAVLLRRMAHSPEGVYAFLDGLKAKVLQKGKSDLSTLIDLKRKELADPKIDKLEAWDYAYYSRILEKQTYDVDQEAVRQYFPVETVISGMFDIYQTLLGVTFVDVTKDVKTWHPDVRAYQIFDKETKKPLAYFLMDLFPRPAKYNHAAAFTLATGRMLDDGSYRSPIAAIVSNFNAPSNGKPSLLTHDEVETLFHEFGHIMHNTLTKSKYAVFSGTNVKRDFVEAPSQMLENWVWQPETLTMMSGNYKNPKEKLPKAMIEKLIAAKKMNIGMFYLRQLSLAYLDMEYHTHAKVDSTAVYTRLATEVALIAPQKGTFFQAGFGHLMGGYDASYYGYMWSDVYAQDMASRFKREGWLNPKTGRDYRSLILESGGTVDPNVLLEKFLGRPANQDAFLEELGVK